MMNAIQKLSCELAAAERKRAARANDLFAGRRSGGPAPTRARPAAKTTRSAGSRPRRPDRRRP